jgi:hypothetical protein
MKPDFDNMARAELRAYMMAHSDDQQAFHTYVTTWATNSKSSIHLPIEIAN